MERLTINNTILSAGFHSFAVSVSIATAGKSKTLKASKTLGVFYFQWLVDQAVSG